MSVKNLLKLPHLSRLLIEKKMSEEEQKMDDKKPVNIIDLCLEFLIQSELKSKNIEQELQNIRHMIAKLLLIIQFDLQNKLAFETIESKGLLNDPQILFNYVQKVYQISIQLLQKNINGEENENALEIESILLKFCFLFLFFILFSIFFWKIENYYLLHLLVFNHT